MADELDLEALRAGERDLARADFRGADLSELNLSDRNFTGTHFDRAHLERANLSKCILNQAKFTGANLTNANLTACQAQGAFVKVKFRGAVFKAAKFRSCSFHNCDFSEADLRGAEFTLVNFETDNVLEGAISDETTRFDGAQVTRAIARHPTFRYYRLEAGRLVRRPEDEIENPANVLRAVGQQDVRLAIQAADEALRELEAQAPEQNHHGTIGHNNPPGEFALERADLDEARDALEILRAEVESATPDLGRIEQARNIAVKIVRKSASWAAEKLDLLSEEFAKEAGKNLASPAGILALTLIFSGQWSRLIELIIKYFS